MSRTVIVLLGAIGSSAALLGCAGEPSTAAPLAGDAAGEASEGEPIGEAYQPINWREAICQTSMNVGGALGCAAVGVYCSGVTTITVGGVALPCALVTVAACASLGAMVEAYKAHGCTLQ